LGEFEPKVKALLTSIHGRASYARLVLLLLRERYAAGNPPVRLINNPQNIGTTQRVHPFSVISVTAPCENNFGQIRTRELRKSARKQQRDN